MRISLVGINARFTHSCLALFYVRNELEVHCPGVEVKISQFTINDNYYEILLQLTDVKADAYFFSTAIWNSDLSVKLITDLRNICPHSSCVIGGPQAEVAGNSLTRKCCTVVVGEIERLDPVFYKDLRNRNLQEKYVASMPRKEFSSPYRHSDFKNHLQHKHIYYESSRGCSFSCTYCLSAAEKGVLHKNLDHVKAELKQILEENPGVVRFVDRTFNDNIDRALTIWKFLVEQDSQALFHFEMNPDRFSEEMFAFLKTIPTGKFQFEIGIQSTNLKTLAAVRRRIDTEKTRDNIHRLRECENIHLHVDLILGLPCETRASFLQSFTEVFAMRPHYIQMGLLKILPDTPICHTAPEYGYIYSASPPYSVFSNTWIGQNEMQNLYWFCECVERFMNNRYFVSLWDYFRKQSVDIVDIFIKLLQRCRQEDFFHRAATQEVLSSLLLKTLNNLPDTQYVKELMRYDWLRCGHRFLPQHLQENEGAVSPEVKKKLFDRLTPRGVDAAMHKEEKYYLKKGFLQAFSRAFVVDRGYEDGDGCHYLCFLPEREIGLYQFNKVIHFYLPRTPL